MSEKVLVSASELFLTVESNNLQLKFVGSWKRLWHYLYTVDHRLTSRVKERALEFICERDTRRDPGCPSYLPVSSCAPLPRRSAVWAAADVPEQNTHSADVSAPWPVCHGSLFVTPDGLMLFSDIWSGFISRSLPGPRSSVRWRRARLLF